MLLFQAWEEWAVLVYAIDLDYLIDLVEEEMETYWNMNTRVLGSFWFVWWFIEDEEEEEDAWIDWLWLYGLHFVIFVVVSFLLFINIL